MNHIASAPIRSGCEVHVATLPENEVSLLRAELELIKHEDTHLKKIAGAAALLVSRLDRVALHGGTAKAAFILAGLIENMPEDMVSEAMSLLQSS